MADLHFFLFFPKCFIQMWLSCEYRCVFPLREVLLYRNFCCCCCWLCNGSYPGLVFLLQNLLTFRMLSNSHSLPVDRSVNDSNSSTLVEFIRSWKKKMEEKNRVLFDKIFLFEETWRMPERFVSFSFFFLKNYVKFKVKCRREQVNVLGLKLPHLGSCRSLDLFDTSLSRCLGLRFLFPWYSREQYCSLQSTTVY